MARSQSSWPMGDLDKVLWRGNGGSQRTARVVEGEVNTRSDGNGKGVGFGVVQWEVGKEERRVIGLHMVDVAAQREQCFKCRLTFPKYRPTFRFQALTATTSPLAFEMAF